MPLRVFRHIAEIVLAPFPLPGGIDKAALRLQVYGAFHRGGGDAVSQRIPLRVCGGEGSAHADAAVSGQLQIFRHGGGVSGGSRQQAEREDKCSHGCCGRCKENALFHKRASLYDFDMEYFAQGEKDYAPCEKTKKDFAAVDSGLSM